MDDQEYIKERVDDQIGWYDKKGMHNQRWYKVLRALETFLSLTTPFLAAFASTFSWAKIVIGAVGLGIAAIASTLNLYKFQENWIEYRSTTEALRHEKYLYLTKSGPYNIECPFNVFVERIESLISKENTNWAQYITRDRKGENCNG